MAGNNIGKLYIPDYHGFVNRQRFCTYSSEINNQSRVLLSPYFTKKTIKNNYKGNYELIQFKNIYPSDDGSVELINETIHMKGGTIATLLASVAIQMGAKNIYFAGLDGYSSSTSVHHYDEPDEKLKKDLLMQEKSISKQLDCLSNLLMKKNNGLVKIITPTVYVDYFDKEILSL